MTALDRPDAPPRMGATVEASDVSRADGSPGKLGSCSLVGVGASAGGLEALRRFVTALPADVPLGFIMIQHLDPTRRSRLAETLAKSSQLPVEWVKDGTTPIGGHVYVVPQGTIASVAGGTLRLRPRPKEACAEVIDELFMSLARDGGFGTCAVLLSGKGSDGTQGLREIAGDGGLTFVQDPGTAGHPEMPRAAIEAGVADFVGSPEVLAAEVAERARRYGTVVASPEDKGAATQRSESLASILTLLRREHGVDFSRYKPSTVKRRVQRRVMLRDLASTTAYLQLLGSDPGELRALFADLLINVTQFFRDADVFEALRTRVFPEIMRHKQAGDAVRVWVPGCSTGEEVYSILITLLEALDSVDPAARPTVSIFGTDASDSAVQTARRAVYPESICQAISPDRLARFFRPVEGGYEVDSRLREMCVFAPQDITKDTPFSRIDLVSVRNVLIYLDATLQAKVLAVTHFALARGGFLVLGTSETPEAQRRLFSVFDKATHVYRRRDVAPHLPLDITGTARMGAEALQIAGLAEEATGFDLQAEADITALDAYAPPRVVVDGEGHIQHFFGDTAPFLEHAEGRATLDAVEMARPGLALDLKEVFEEARSGVDPVFRTTTFAWEGSQRRVSIEAKALAAPAGETYLLVAFRELAGGSMAAETGSAPEDVVRLYESRDERFRRELAALRARLRTVSDEKERASAGLRSANEEVRSANEELQSINEELETSREELQSANEELITVNDELRKRNRDLVLAGDDINNFLASTEIPVLMLDRDLNVRRHTPLATRVVHILPTDEGRPVQHLRFTVAAASLEEDAREVMASAEPRRREVRHENGRWYSMEIRPYRSVEDRVDGVVVSFLDIDDLKKGIQRAERQARLTDALNELDRGIASTMSIDEIMQCAIDDGVAALGVDGGTIEIREDEDLIVRYQRGFEAEDLGLRLAPDEAPIATEAMRRSVAVSIADVRADERANVGVVRAHGVRSMLAVPLVIKGEPIGCVLFHRRVEAAAFDELQLDFARRLGASVSLALENTRLVQSERRAARLSEALNRVNEILGSAVTRDEITARLVGDVSQVAGADKCLVINAHDGLYAITHVRGVLDDLVGVDKPESFYPAFARCASQRRPILIEDTWGDPGTNEDFVVAHGLRAFQLLPLIVDDHVLGVLALAYDEPRRFYQEDLEFSERLARAMSVALTNATLYEAEREAQLRAASELETTSLLLRGATILAESSDLEPRLDRLVETMRSAVPGTRAVVYGIVDDAALRVLAAGGGASPPVGATLPLVGMTAIGQEMFRTGKSAVVDFDSLPEDERGIGERFGVHRLLAVPAVYQDGIVGALVVDDPADAERDFGPREIGIIEAFAAQAATAMESARLLEAERIARRAEAERAQRSAVLKDIAESSSSSLDLHAVAASVVGSVLGLLGARQAQIRLVDGAGSVLESAASAGLPEGFLERLGPIPVDADVETALCFRSKEPRIGEDVKATRPVKASRKNARDAGVRSYILVPLIAGGEAIGTFYVAWGEPKRFGSEEIAFVEAVAAQSAVGLENARLFGTERRAQQRARQELETTGLLLKTADILATRTAVDSALEQLADTLLDSTDHGRVTLNLWDETRRELRTVVSRGIAAMSPATFDYDVLSPQIKEIIDTGKTVVFDYDTLSAGPTADLAAERAIHLGLVVPLVYQDRVVGLIGVDSPGERREFEPREIERLEGVAAQAAVAVENARLFEAERERLVRIQALSEMSEIALSSMDAREVADAALAYVGETLGVTASTLWTADEGRQRLAPVGGTGFPKEFYAEFSEGVGVDDSFVVARSFTEQRAIAHEDAKSDDVPEPVRAAYARHGLSLRSLLVVPLRGRGEVFGAITYAWDRPQALDEAEVSYYSALTNAFAAGLENARLFAARGEALTRKEQLEDVATAAASSLSVDEISEQVLATVRGMPDVAVCAIYAIEPERSVLRAICMFGYPDDMLDSMREIPISETSNPGRVALHDLDLLTHEDPGNPPETVARLEHMGLPEVRWVSLPLRKAGELVGVIGLIFRGLRSFDPQEIAQYRGFASTLGQALANARLFEDINTSNERLTDILDSMTDGFVTVDRNWRYTLVNPAAERLIGKTAHELAGRSMDELFPEIEGWPHYRKTMEERVATAFETYSEPLARWLEVRAYPAAEGMSIFFADISQRVAAQASLAEARARRDVLATLLDAASQPFGVGGPDGELLEFNVAFAELTGYTGDELRQIDWSTDLTPPEYRELETARLEELVRTGGPVRYEKEYVRKDGSRVPVELLVHVAKNDAGGIDYYYSFVTDLTERKAAEEALRESERRYRLLFANMLDGFAYGRMIFDEAGEPMDFVYLDVNESFERLTGLGDVAGRRVTDVIPGLRESNPELFAAYGRVAITGEPERLETEIEQLGVWFSVSVYGPQPGYFVAIFDDITERRQRDRLSEALNTIGSAVSASLEADAIVERLLTMSSEALGADVSAAALKQGDRWVTADVRGLAAEDVAAVLAAGLAEVMPSADSRVRPYVYADVTCDERVAPLADIGVRSLLAVPLLAGNDIFGMLVFGDRTRTGSFTAVQCEFALKLMSVATVALENAALYEREKRIADTLQRAVLEPPAPIEGLDVSYVYRTASNVANVGGDFYDLFEIAEGTVGLLIGDVSGKGLEAARLTSIVRDGVRAYSYENADPSWVLSHVNMLLYRSSPVESFVTLFFGVLDIQRRTLAYCSAGHPPAILTQSGKVRHLSQARTGILGAFPKIEFPSELVVLEAGAVLTMYTDGVTEARSGGALFGEARLVKTLEDLADTPVAEIPEALLAVVTEYSSGEVRDDTAILCVRLKEPGEE